MYHNPPLFKAACLNYKENLEVIELLMKAGCNPNETGIFKHFLNECIETSIIGLAVERRRTDLLEYFIDKVEQKTLNF